MDIDAVQQRPRQARHVALHFADAAPALPFGIGAAPARALLRCLVATGY
jgi:hypothetical protein